MYVDTDGHGNVDAGDGCPQVIADADVHGNEDEGRDVTVHVYVPVYIHVYVNGIQCNVVRCNAV